jgi:hypothetical protein
LVVHIFVYSIWSLLLEIPLVFLNLLLEVLNRVVNLSFQVNVGFVDDTVGFTKSLKEFVPGII